jgi:hypothetical protein
MRKILLLLLVILVFSLFVKGMKPSIEKTQSDFQAYSRHSLLPEDTEKAK